MMKPQGVGGELLKLPAGPQHLNCGFYGQGALKYQTDIL